MKQCNNCKEDKSLDEFYTVNKRGKPTIYHLCKTCCSSKKKVDSSYYRDWELKKKYGVTLETYKAECALRDNKCDICSRQVKALHVDHNHTTMQIRGYLCGSCNRGIGLLQDSSSILQNAISYLHKYG